MDCLICKSKCEKHQDYYFCDHCKFVFKDQTLLLTENEEKSRYDLHNNSIENEGYVQFFSNYINQVVPLLKGKFGLDYGCGPSNVLAQLLERDYSFEIDSYDKYYEHTPVLKNTYDFITCTEVFEHIANPLKFFKELDAYINSGGVIAFMTLFHSSDLEEFFKWWYIRDATHISFYNLETFNYLAKLFNYKISYTDNKMIVVMQKQ